MPPIQWVKLLHIRRHLGSSSTEVRILAPVVVKPLTTSKKASTGFFIHPLITKGTAPMKLKRIQPRAVLTMLSLV